jgi:hypothetical protein
MNDILYGLSVVWLAILFQLGIIISAFSLHYLCHKADEIVDFMKRWEEEEDAE